MSSDDPSLHYVQEAFEEAEIADEDREFIDEVLAEMRRENLSESLRRSHLEWLTRTAVERHGDDEDEEGHGIALPSILEDEDAVDELRDWINSLTRKDNGEPYAEWTTHKIRQAFRKAGAIMGPDRDNKDVPFPVSKFSGTFHGDLEDTAPRRGEVFYWDQHMVPLIEDGATNPRDEAYFAVAWDAACRPWEVRDLTYGQVSREGPWLEVTVGGKNTPDRTNTLYAATPYLAYWLDIKHPANDTRRGLTPDTAVWPKLDVNEELAKESFANIFPRAVKRAGLEMPTGIKYLRKSRASILATRVADPETSYDQWDLENHMGWEHGTPVAPIYISRFGTISNAKRGRVDGVPEEYLPDYGGEGIEDPAPVMCPHCDEFTPKHRDRCLFCKREFVVADAAEVDLEDSREAVEREVVEHQERRNALMRDVATDQADPEKLDLAVRHGDFLAGNEDAADAAKALRDALDSQSDGESND